MPSSPADAWEVEQFVLDEVLQLVAERALAITGADGVAIAMAEDHQIICRASAGKIAPDAGARLDPNSGFSGACFRSGQIVRCDDAEADPRVNVHACRRLGTRSMVAVPLCGQRRVIGLLEAFSSEAYGFNDSDVRSLNLLAELILAAIKPEDEERLEQVSQSAAAEAAEPAEQAELAIPNGRAELASGAESERKSSEGENAPALFCDYQETQTSRPGLVVVLVVVLIAALLGAGLWWAIQRRAPGSSAASQPGTPSGPPAQTAYSASAPTPAPVVPNDMSSPSVIQEKLAVLPQVTGIRHWSSAGSSTVVIDLQDQVQYEAHRLTSPERVYFDLHDTALAPALFGKTIEVGDGLLVRVRVAQPMSGVTRVVLETTGATNFSVSLEPNPYRLVVEVRAVGAPKPQANTTIDLFGPSVQAERTRLTVAAPTRESEDAKWRTRVPKFRIALDAGHGGWDLGTVGRKGLLEKDLVLDIAERLGSLLANQLGAEVLYTRPNDTYIPLEDRADIANQAQADLFVSIHANYSDYPSARGVETYFTNTFISAKARPQTQQPAAGTFQNAAWANVDIREKTQESRRLAASVQHTLYGMLAVKNRGMRDRGVKQASYVVLTGTTMPAILAEVSFVSSPADEGNLQSTAYRQRIAAALYKGIARYAASSHRVKLASTSAKPTGR